jgi:hypothetical protein
MCILFSPFRHNMLPDRARLSSTTYLNLDYLTQNENLSLKYSLYGLFVNFKNMRSILCLVLCVVLGCV